MTSSSSMFKKQSEIIENLSSTKGLSVSSLISISIPATYCL